MNFFSWLHCKKSDRGYLSSFLKKLKGDSRIEKSDLSYVSFCPKWSNSALIPHKKVPRSSKLFCTWRLSLCVKAIFTFRQWWRWNQKQVDWRLPVNFFSVCQPILSQIWLGNDFCHFQIRASILPNYITKMKRENCIMLRLSTVGTPNKARKNFRQIGSNKAKFQIRQPIALFANFAISSQIRQILATSQTFWVEIDPFTYKTHLCVTHWSYKDTFRQISPTNYWNFRDIREIFHPKPT